MGSKPRKPASSKAGRPHPRIGSTGVQKPPRTVADASATVPASLPADGTAATPERIRLAPGLVNLDWLALNLEAPEGSPGVLLPWDCFDPAPWWDSINSERRYITQPTNRRTEQFNRVTTVHDERGEKVLTVWHDPHSNGMHRPNWVQVQFANETLYTGEWYALFSMLRALGCKVTSVSKLDISCDGIEGAGGEFLKVVDTTRHGNARFYGHCDWVVRGARSKATGAEFGHRSSNKFVRCYRKKREMKSKGIKQHIVHKWCAAWGFNPMTRPGEVVRFEGSFKGKEVRRYFPEEKLDPDRFVEQLADTANLVDIVASMAMGMFDVRAPKYKRGRNGTAVEDRARSAEPVAVWDWSQVVKVPPSLAFRAQRNLGISDHTIKTELRALFRAAVVTAQPALMDFAKAQAVAAGPHWEEWFQRKAVEWTKQYGKLIAAGDERAIEFFNRLADPEPGPELHTREEWETIENYENFNRFSQANMPPPITEESPEPFNPFDPDADGIAPW